MKGRAPAGSLAIARFTRDLRLDDHLVLLEAARFGTVLPVFVLDEALAARIRPSSRRVAYLCRALAALDASLRAVGSALVVRRGAAGESLALLARASGAETILWSQPYDAAAVREADAVQERLEGDGFRAYGVHDAPAVAPEEIAAARSDGGDVGYRSFAPFLVAWEGRASAPHHGRVAFVPRAELPPLEPLPTPDEFRPGEPPLVPDPAIGADAILARLRAYLAGPALRYDVARAIPSFGETTRTSAALAFGLLSARTFLAAIRERGADPFLLAEERVALGALARSLARRDFFLQLAWFFERRPDEPLREAPGLFETSHPALAAWDEGRTGFPLVDAGIRQLRTTGWMHPHARRVAASFLCFDLGVDWRVGRDAWERELEEDDVALATGNWQWSAGVGADLAAFPRIFNPTTQLRRIDPEATYVRRFVPELARIDPAEILGGTRRIRRQLALPLYDESAYPQPVVEHGAAARAFLARRNRLRGS